MAATSGSAQLGPPVKCSTAQTTDKVAGMNTKPVTIQFVTG